MLRSPKIWIVKQILWLLDSKTRTVCLTRAKVVSRFVIRIAIKNQMYQKCSHQSWERTSRAVWILKMYHMSYRSRVFWSLPEFNLLDNKVLELHLISNQITYLRSRTRNLLIDWCLFLLLRTSWWLRKKRRKKILVRPKESLWVDKNLLLEEEQQQSWQVIRMRH